jgi:hypothetical protein
MRSGSPQLDSTSCTVRPRHSAWFFTPPVRGFYDPIVPLLIATRVTKLGLANVTGRTFERLPILGELLSLIQKTSSKTHHCSDVFGSTQTITVEGAGLLAG